MKLQTPKPIKAALFLLAVAPVSCSKDNSNEQTSQKYYPDVKTIIQNNCISCHSSTGTWTGQPIKLDTDADITSQYIQIKKSVADPASPMNLRMPQNGTLTQTEINTIVNWYNKGGKVSD